jgi:FSR family fosmidomycin resistance protein-like MFS transporter
MRDYLRNGKLLSLMLGHLTVDSYAGFIPVLFPLLIEKSHASLATVGLVSLAYIGTSALSQPVFGLIADRYGTRLTGIALGWTALTFSLSGFAPTFPILLLCVCAAGMGSGAFHPLAALDVRALLHVRRRTSGMSIFVTAGTVGLAVGPLIGILLLGRFGLRGTGLLVIPGVAAGSYLLWRMRGSSGPAAAIGKQSAAIGGAVPILALVAVIGVMMSRNWTVSVLMAYTPTWYRELGYGPGFYGPLVTTLVLAGALGTVGIGAIADRFGRRPLILATLALSIPPILLYTVFPGPWAFGSAILIGFLAASTTPLMLLMAQQLMIARIGFASGLVLGLAFIAGAIGIPITGAIGDAVGLQKALTTNVILVLATIAIAWFLPSERDLGRYSVTSPDSKGAVRV